LELKECVIQNLKKVEVKYSEKYHIDEAFLLLQQKKRNDTDPDQAK
jgi:hypothetical protein